MWVICDNGSAPAYGPWSSSATVATKSRIQPTHTSASARERRRPCGRIAAENTAAPISSAMPAYSTARDREEHAHGSVSVALRFELGRELFRVDRRAADRERERAVHRMRVGGDHAPRQHVRAVAHIGHARFDHVVRCSRVMRRPDVDAVALLVEQLDRSQRDLDVLGRT